MYDLKIVGGTIVDGTGRDRFRGDVGVKDGKIAAIGKADEAAKETFHAGSACWSADRSTAGSTRANGRLRV